MLTAFLVTATEEAGDLNPLIPAIYVIVWSAVCFAIILFFFWWKFLPNITKTLDARAEAIEGVLAKLTIWRTLSDGAEGEISAGAPPRLNRLVLSIEADLVRLRRGAARRRR